MIHPLPRAYIDWTVPVDDLGNEIGVCRDTVTYQLYLEWLADYLFSTKIPVPQNQQDILEEFESEDGIKSAVFRLSENLGDSIWDTELIERSYLEGLSYEEYHKIEVGMWEDLSDDERELHDRPEEDFFTSKADYNRIGEEAINAAKVPSHILHADICYRPIFAKLLKTVESKKDRIAYLDYFYRNFNECASK